MTRSNTTVKNAARRSSRHNHHNHNPPKSSRHVRRSSSRRRRRRYSADTAHDLETLLEWGRGSSEKRPPLKSLKLLGTGVTKDVFRKGDGDFVYKYHVRRSTMTRFATPAKVLLKMQALQLVIPEVRINDALYSAEYCTPVFPDDIAAMDVVRCNILLTLFADALAQHDIYGMDLHTGNIGRRARDGMYCIIDDEGFFEAATSMSHPNATMLTNVGAVANGVFLPHATECTWVDFSDPTYGWFGAGDDTEWVRSMVSYKTHMAAVRTHADIRLRNFVSHYFRFGDHMSYGLCLLRITKVYADATSPTQRAVDRFLTRVYHETSYIPYARIGDEYMYRKYALGRTAWLLDAKRRPTFPEDLEQFATLLTRQPFYTGVRNSVEKPTSSKHTPSKPTPSKPTPSKPTYWSEVKRLGKVVAQVSLVLGCVIGVGWGEADYRRQLSQLRKQKEAVAIRYPPIPVFSRPHSLF
jgi:hypothetical protein